jgi:prohibitin 1
MPQFPRAIDTGSFGFNYVRSLGLGLLLLFVLYLSATMVPAGHVGVKDFFGSVSDRALGPGISLVIPGTRVLKFSTQTREIKEAAAVPISEGLIVNLDVSLLFRLRPDVAPHVYKTVGRQFEQVIIEPQLRSAIRDVTAEYEAKFLYSAEREKVAQNIFKHMKAALAPRGVEAEQVLLRNMQLPPLLTTAIQEKLQAEQQAQRMRFVLDRERQEADRKRVEAQGIADFQAIVAKGISAELGDKSGLPIILTDK